VASFIAYKSSFKDERLALEKQKPAAKPDSVKPSSSQAATTSSSKNAEIKPEPATTDSKPLIAKAKSSGPSASPKPTTTIKQPKPDANALAQATDQPTSFSVNPPVTTETASGNVLSTIAEEKESKPEEVLSSAPVMDSKKKEATQTSRTARAVTASIQKKISGQVLSAADGSPMPGVNVTIKGTNEGTVTDANGSFKLDLNQPNQSLVFSFVGFEPQEVNAVEKDKLDVSLKEDATQLSEVVVTGYGAPKDPDAEPVIKLAEPVGGRKAYDKYLDDNLRYPQQALENKVKGRVVIEFTVRIDGSIDEFNVIKKLGYGCDEEVIRLVKEGPAWKPTTQDNVAIESNVRVRMKFNPQKKK
jgi:TonB family protein